MKKILTIAMLTLAVLFSVQFPLVANAASTPSRKDGKINGCTVWITRDTPVYKSGKKVATIPKGKKLEILREKNSRFLVKYKGKKGYVDSTYVLINIKEYIPSLDIRLDMSQKNNLFNMADEKIPHVSDKRFYTSSGSKKGSEAWLRYGAAKKLLKAEKKFLKEGYSIVIYDAYRPYSVTCKIRDGFKDFLRGKSYSFKSKWFGSLGESWFLAQHASSHNYGRAIDMSLKKVKTDKLFQMPSKMHTLDKRAAYYTWVNGTSKSAKNARYLKKVMESVGFTYLKSEWWHFQDNSIPNGNVLDLKI